MSDGPWQFSLPSIDLVAAIRLGQKTYQVPLVADTLCLVPGQRRLWIVARRAFVYQFLPERPREIQIVQANAAGLEDGGTTIAKEMASKMPTVSIEPPDAPENMPIPWDMLRELHPLTNILEGLPLLASG